MESRTNLLRRGLCVAAVIASWLAGPAHAAADLESCRALLLRGEYEDCQAAVAAEITRGGFGESWPVLQAEAEWRLGRYTQAWSTLKDGLTTYPWSVRLRWAAWRTAPFAGESAAREKLAEEIARLVQASPWRYTDAENLVALGEFVLAQGGDPKQVQDAFFQRARRNYPLHRAPVLALGELALSKRDFRLAAGILRPALEQHPDDPDIRYGLARALMESDPGAAQAQLADALQRDPRHAPSLLLRVDRWLDGERYDVALSDLDRVLETNPEHPGAWARKAVIADLQGDSMKSAQQRDRALTPWSGNPEVDFLIGRRLSRKYRFADGAAAQRRALALDSEFQPAAKQLAEDLLRLGQEEEGWRLAREAFQRDQYDVALYNLVSLRDALDRYTVLTPPGFQIRMDAREAEVYGWRVIELLQEARTTLATKYAVELPRTIYVEIFPNPADFAVRTFGLPEAGSYLGVCFGDVVTAQSPAAFAGRSINWESVLWHEFAHVVTLNKTRNRMPRWLSEGISVYEERLRHPAAGERMSLTYRDMLLGDDFTPLSRLSEAFLSPKSAAHVQFAYFESALAVEHLIDEYGFAALIGILDDLGVGMSLPEALERRTTALAELDAGFESAARQQAEEFAADVNWERPALEEQQRDVDPVAQLIAWRDAHPQHYHGLLQCGELLQRLGQGDAARTAWEMADAAFPYDTDARSPVVRLVEGARARGDVADELQWLEAWRQRDDAAAAPRLRLIELQRERKDWTALHEAARSLLAVQPLLRSTHEALATASEQLAAPQSAADAWRAVLALQPPDRVEAHYRLARQLQLLEQRADAQRHVLRALEEAPRYRAALRLLLELQPEDVAETVQQE